MSTKWVRNEVANEVVAKLQHSIALNDVDKVALQATMDLISGVEGYNIWDTNRQGIIRKTFEHERYKHNGGKAGNSASFGTDMSDVVSTFWEAVFKYLPRASMTGEIVSVRVVEGQHTDDPDDEKSTSGLTFAHRNTNCNPVHYLRNMGIMGVRNMLNKAYRRNIMMVCDDCGGGSSVSTKEDSAACVKCSSKDTCKYWPTGNSSYRSKKYRLCKTCGHTWQRQFNRKCVHCSSQNVRIDARAHGGDEVLAQTPSGTDTETTLSELECDLMVDGLIGKLYNYLPLDPRDPKAVSKTKEVFDILVRPEASADMCKQCVSSAKQFCTEKCKLFKKNGDCGHEKVLDLTETCGADHFVIGKCVNFSKKIGEYHNCSASLAARRVKKVREYVKRYLEEHASDEDCAAASALLKKMNV